MDSSTTRPTDEDTRSRDQKKVGPFVYRLRIPPFQGGEEGSIPSRAARRNRRDVGKPGNPPALGAGWGAAPH